MRDGLDNRIVVARGLIETKNSILRKAGMPESALPDLLRAVLNPRIRDGTWVVFGLRLAASKHRSSVTRAKPQSTEQGTGE